MQVTHQMTISARCPVDKKLDTYSAEFSTDRVVKVEDILAAVNRVAEREIFQEDLTVLLARELGVKVTTVGYHSGVLTKVSA